MARKQKIVATATARNVYRVQKAQWRKWNAKGRKTFNWLFGLMMKQPDLFAHPKAKPIPREHRKTTAWNAAWLAADAVCDAAKA